MESQRPEGGGDRWEAPAQRQRDAARARIYGETSSVSQSGGVQMKWVFVWLVASAGAIMALRHLDMVERFEQGLTREREARAMGSEGGDFDRELEETTHKKDESQLDRLEDAPAGPPVVTPSDYTKHSRPF